MKRIIAFTWVLTLWLTSAAFALNCNQITKEQIIKQLPPNPFLNAFFQRATIVNKRQVKGYCEIVLNINGRLMPIYLKDDLLIWGRIYSKGQELSKNIIAKLKVEQNKKNKQEFLKKRSQLDKLAAIVYKPSPQAKKVLYMITDPVCPFCKRAESSIKQLVDKYNVILKIVLFSVHPPKGEQKAIEAVCRGFNLDQYLKHEWKKKKVEPKYECKKGKELIQETKKVVQALGVRGVPTFIFEDGSKVVGARISELEALLKKETKAKK